MAKKRKPGESSTAFAISEAAATALDQAHEADKAPDAPSPADMAKEDDWHEDEDGGLGVGDQPDTAGIAMSSGKNGNGKAADAMTKARAARKGRDPDAPRPRYIVIGQARTSEDWDVLHVAKSARSADKWLAESRALIKRVYSEVTVFRAKPVNVVGY